MNPTIESVSLLYFEGCPSWKAALKNLHQVLGDLNLQVEVDLIRIDTPEQAQQEKFLGSPSIRVNGVDLWPEERETCSLSCRVYQTPEGFLGVPTVDMLAGRINEVLASGGRLGCDLPD